MAPHEDDARPQVALTEGELAALEDAHRGGAGMATRDQGRLLREVRWLRQEVAEWRSWGVDVREQVAEMLEARD